MKGNPVGSLHTHLGVCRPSEEEELKPDTPLEPVRHTRVALGQEDEVQVLYRRRPWLGRRAATAPAPTSGGIGAHANSYTRDGRRLRI